MKWTQVCFNISKKCFNLSIKMKQQSKNKTPYQANVYKITLYLINNNYNFNIETQGTSFGDKI